MPGLSGRIGDRRQPPRTVIGEAGRSPQRIDRPAQRVEGAVDETGRLSIAPDARGEQALAVIGKAGFAAIGGARPADRAARIVGRALIGPGARSPGGIGQLQQPSEPVPAIAGDTLARRGGGRIVAGDRTPGRVILVPGGAITGDMLLDQRAAFVIARGHLDPVRPGPADDVARRVADPADRAVRRRKGGQRTPAVIGPGHAAPAPVGLCDQAAVAVIGEARLAPGGVDAPLQPLQRVPLADRARAERVDLLDDQVIRVIAKAGDRAGGVDIARQPFLGEIEEAVVEHAVAGARPRHPSGRVIGDLDPGRAAVLPPVQPAFGRIAIMELAGERALHIEQMPGRVIAIADQRLALALHPQRAQPALRRGVDAEARAVGNAHPAQPPLGIAVEDDAVAVAILDPRHQHPRGVAGRREDQIVLAAAVIQAQRLARAGQPVIGRLEVACLDMRAVTDREDQPLAPRILEQRGARLGVERQPLRPVADPPRAEQPLDAHPARIGAFQPKRQQPGIFEIDPCIGIIAGDHVDGLAEQSAERAVEQTALADGGAHSHHLGHRQQQLLGDRQFGVGRAIAAGGVVAEDRLAPLLHHRVAGQLVADPRHGQAVDEDGLAALDDRGGRAAGMLGAGGRIGDPRGALALEEDVGRTGGDRAGQGGGLRPCAGDRAGDEAARRARAEGDRRPDQRRRHARRADDRRGADRHHRAHHDPGRDARKQAVEGIAVRDLMFDMRGLRPRRGDTLGAELLRDPEGPLVRMDLFGQPRPGHRPRDRRGHPPGEAFQRGHPARRPGGIGPRREDARRGDMPRRRDRRHGARIARRGGLLAQRAQPFVGRRLLGGGRAARHGIAPATRWRR